MLKVTIPRAELYNSKTKEFFYTKEQTLTLEHSLVSISKWESKWKKVFLSDTAANKKTSVELLDYIRCMTLTQNVPIDVYDRIPDNVLKQITVYMEDSQSATKLRKSTGKKSRDVMSSEMIYYLMVANNVPLDPCQKWHINRLLTLLRICGIKNSAASGRKSKASSKDIARRNRERNQARRQAMNSSG